MTIEGIDELVLVKYIKHVVGGNIQVKFEYGNILYRKDIMSWSLFSTSPQATLRAAYSWNSRKNKQVHG